MAKQSSDKPLIILRGEIKSPPLSEDGRKEAGFLLRLVQKGELIEMPHSRPMRTIGKRCHELRITDNRTEWRLIYRIDSDAILLADVFQKKTQETPPQVIDGCRDRLAVYDDAVSAAAKPKPKPKPKRKR